ncbi:MAG TPA: SDR family NAD(P)-dependent oxidoreductase [Pseudonocardiaceae bacterium]|nr:SDR family NAD(P)-dependent oxidoreductase [Pseudonocardiaceae bacterium]
MRPVAEQTVLVTGATDGLGKGLATELARAGATVLLHGRDDNRGKATLADITAATGSDRLRWYRADLAHLDQVRDLAAAGTADTPRLDALVSNAGIGTDTPPGRQESADGIELRFARQLSRRFLTHPAAAAHPACLRPGPDRPGQLGWTGSHQFR